MIKSRFAVGLLFLAGSVFAQTGNKPPLSSPTSAVTAGVCTRCHINDVVEWEVSKHYLAGVTCTNCHGPTIGHVLDERNRVKPDRIPGDKQVAGLCQTCHQDGCPKTTRKDACQTCHHVHALVNVNPSTQTAPVEEKSANDSQNRRRFQEALVAGEAWIQQAKWTEAISEFKKAQRLQSDSAPVARRLAYCQHRLNPEMKGFQRLTEAFDPVFGCPLRVEVKPLKLIMLWVGGGEFDMGDPAFPDSIPVHTVGVGPFYLGQMEVTQEQWLKVMGFNPSHYQTGYSNHLQMPVENVSWDDCQEFIARLNCQVDGGGFRLPTEAEWEYAARKGLAQTAVPELEAVARYRENSELHGPDHPGEFAPSRVGSRQPNAMGLYDLQGNVWEWCSSLFRPYLYDARDGREDCRQTGLRILRGGSFMDGPDLLSFGLRHADRPQRRLRWNGLRLVRDVPQIKLGDSP